MDEKDYKIIDEVIKNIAPSFMFGFHSEADMIQQAWIFACEAYPCYDGERSLGAFISRHIRNRLINYKRDTYHRAQKPCKRCPFARGELCDAFSEKSECEKHEDWIRRNATKRSLHHFAPIEAASGHSSQDSLAQKMILDEALATLSIAEQGVISKYIEGEKIPAKQLNPILAKLRAHLE